MEFIVHEHGGCIGANGDPAIVIDVGANVGFFSGQAAALGCSVYSFEPQKATSSCIKATACINGWSDTNHIFRQPVSSMPVIGFPIQNHAGNTGGVSQSICERGNGSPCEWIPTVQLDSFNFEKVLILKTDIEGFDIAALETASKMLAQRRISNVLLELTPGGNASGFGADSPKLGVERNSAFLSKLCDWGYSLAEIPYAKLDATHFKAIPLNCNHVFDFVQQIVSKGALGLDGERRPFTDVWANLVGANTFEKYNEQYSKGVSG